MGYSETQKYMIWLGSVRGLGAVKFDGLIALLNTPQQVWEEVAPWMGKAIGEGAYQALKQARTAAYFDQLFEDIERAGAVAITRDDPEYPALLRGLLDAPPVLFVRGRTALIEEMSLAIVGARNCTAYGTRMARRIARELSAAGVTVVSGLARGIDSQAHRGAVDEKARTIAVLGSGVDVIYPPEHLRLADEILDNGGSIVSELRPGSPPSPQHFPARNRIISGLSAGVLLVEGAKRSGAALTVRCALEQSREVMALPGQADSPLSAKTHELIRDGARLVTSAADILEDMGWFAPKPSAPRAAKVLPLTQSEQRIWNALAGGAADTDELVAQLSVPPPALYADLTNMELQGLIRKLPGRKVERIEHMEE
ncbi:MAG: DNA-processing protein DprA [Oscillospiraceae bacterium]|jgi:DNA processing protein|nr:DNA-processing protein DprA [Oscillospiraceae bacterium]